MPIIRLTIILVFIASLVLLATFVVTRNPKYLAYIKQILKYTGWGLLVVAVLYLMARVIRL